MNDPILPHRKPVPERTYEAKQRLCLKCRRPFASTWSGERVCQKCKSKPSWREGGNALYECD